MIYLFVGERAVALRQAQRLERALRQRAPDASVHHLDAEEVSPQALEALVGSCGIFYQRSLVRILEPWGRKEWRDALETLVSAMAQDENLYFLVGTPPIPPSLATLLHTHARRVVETPVSAHTQTTPDGFAAARAWGEGDVARAWRLLRMAIDKGEAPEALVGAFLWFLKNVIQVGCGVQGGVRPSLRPVAHRALSRWHLNGAVERHYQLVRLYHHAHQGGVDLARALEYFVLTDGAPLER